MVQIWVDVNILAMYSASATTTVLVLNSIRIAQNSSYTVHDNDTKFDGLQPVAQDGTLTVTYKSSWIIFQKLRLRFFITEGAPYGTAFMLPKFTIHITVYRVLMGLSFRFSITESDSYDDGLSGSHHICQGTCEWSKNHAGAEHNLYIVLQCLYKWWHRHKNLTCSQPGVGYWAHLVPKH